LTHEKEVCISKCLVIDDDEDDFDDDLHLTPTEALDPEPPIVSSSAYSESSESSAN
jgi:hypothetical protein